MPINGERDADPQQSFAAHRDGNEINQQGEPLRPVDHGKRGDQAVSARRSADDRRAKVFRYHRAQKAFAPRRR